MPDSKLADLTELTTPAAADLYYTEQSGQPRKISRENLQTGQSASNVSYTAPGTGGQTVTVQAFTQRHPHIFDYIPPVQQAAIEARTSTYDAADDIEAARDQLCPNTNEGGILDWCDGEVRTSKTIVLPTFCWLRGDSNRHARLTALAPFTGSYVLQLGSTTEVFNTGAERMWISANDIPGLIPVYSARANEGSGLIGCELRDFDRTGVFFEHTGAGGAQNFTLHGNEIFPNNDDEISISSITESAGVATASSTAHGWSAGDIFTLKGASPNGYKGVKKVATVPDADSFTFAVESGIGNATGTIVASRRICMRLDINNAGKSHISNGSLVADNDGAGIGILINKAIAHVGWVHCEKMSVGIATGLDDSSLGLEVHTFHGRTDLEIVAQVNGDSFAVVDLRNILGSSNITVHDSLYGLRYTDGKINYATGSGTQPDGVLVTDGTGDKGIQLRAPIRPFSYTVAGVPSASTAGAGAMIFVSDETGGAVPAFSDGTNWRRMTDRAIIS